MTDDPNKKVEGYLQDVDEFIDEIGEMIDDTIQVGSQPVDENRGGEESSDLTKPDRPQEDEIKEKVSHKPKNGRRIFPTGRIGK